MGAWRKLIRDPLCHFALLAMALFAVNAVNSQSQEESKVITVDQARIDWLAAGSTRERGRAPSSEELQLLIDNYVREEVLYREARAMRLDQDDAIIRRRLIKKLTFMIEDVATAEQPGQQALEQFYQQHINSFRQPERYSYSHIYFSTDARTDARQDAVNLRQQLSNSEAPPSGPVGDAFMLGYSFVSQSHLQVVDQFGENFAREVSLLSEGEWLGPVRSAYGWHLVKLNQRHLRNSPKITSRSHLAPGTMV